MDTKKYINPIISTATLSGATLFLTLSRLSPCITYSSTTFCQQTSKLNISIFYLANLLFLSSILTLLNFLTRAKLSQNQHLNHDFNVSLRQGILLSLFTNLCLVFISLNILTWWSSLILLVMTILTEFLFLQKQNLS